VVEEAPRPKPTLLECRKVMLSPFTTKRANTPNTLPINTIDRTHKPGEALGDKVLDASLLERVEVEALGDSHRGLMRPKTASRIS